MSITKLVETLEQTQSTAYKTFATEQSQRQFVRQLSATTFFESYQALFYAALCFSLLAQVASAVSSYSFFEALLQVKLSHPILLGGAVGFVLVSIEVAKYTVVNKACKELFALQPQQHLVLYVLALCISGLSTYASITGGGKLGIDTTQPQTVSRHFDNEIAALKADLAAITHRNTWQGRVYLPAQEKKLVYAKEAELTALKASKAQALAQVAAHNQANETQFKLGFAGFELLFFVCTVFGWYYKRRSSVEFLATSSTSLTTPLTPAVEQTPPPQLGGSPTPPSAPSPRIGFVFGTKQPPTINENSEGATKRNENSTSNRSNENSSPHNRQCVHCQQAFVYNHRKHIYCTTACRIAAWQQRKGRVLHRPKRHPQPQVGNLFGS